MTRSATIPAALLTLSAIPLAAGTLRLIQLAGGPQLIPADDRFATLPLPLVLHIVAAAGYAVGGVFQFVPRLRRSRPAWHRRAGRTLAVAGLLVALSALWMTIAYAPKPGTGDLLYLSRLVFGAAMSGCLILGFAAIRRRDIRSLRAWMIRAYAIGLAAGTQVLTEGIGILPADIAKVAGWLINLAVAEWVIRFRVRSQEGNRDHVRVPA
jgi:hypothetical protein